MIKATVLMYHIIDRPLSDQEARYCCAPDLFEKHIRYLAASGRAIGLDELVLALSGQRQPPKDAVAITFDDGFTATFANALPVLVRYRIPATMFVVSGKLGGYNDWMTPRGFPRRPLVNEDQLLALRDAGITVGSHTRTHPRLPGIGRGALAQEIGGSKSDLENRLREEVKYFAYPFGLYDAAAKQMAEAAGYRAACSTRAGFNNPDVSQFELRRMEVYGWDALWRFRQKLKYGRNVSSLMFPVTYYLDRARAHLGL